MRKLTKLDLQGLSETMDLLSTEEQNMYVGTYSNDCFWRCVAYIKSGNTDYTEATAASYAMDYFTSEIFGRISNSNLSDEAASYLASEIAMAQLVGGGAGIGIYDAMNYLRANGLGDDAFRFVQLDDVGEIASYQAAGFSSSGSMGHTVLWKGYTENGYLVFDPQKGRDFEITREEYVRAGAARCGYSPYESNSGNGDNGGGSGESDNSGSYSEEPRYPYGSDYSGY